MPSPNIVYLMFDQAKASAMSFMGNNEIDMPFCSYGPVSTGSRRNMPSKPGTLQHTAVGGAYAGGRVLHGRGWAL